MGMHDTLKTFFGMWVDDITENYEQQYIFITCLCSIANNFIPYWFCPTYQSPSLQMTTQPIISIASTSGLKKYHHFDIHTSVTVPTHHSSPCFDLVSGLPACSTELGGCDRERPGPTVPIPRDVPLQGRTWVNGPTSLLLLLSVGRGKTTRGVLCHKLTFPSLSCIPWL